MTTTNRKDIESKAKRRQITKEDKKLITKCNQNPDKKVWNKNVDTRQTMMKMNVCNKSLETRNKKVKRYKLPVTKENKSKNEIKLKCNLNKLRAHCD